METPYGAGVDPTPYLVATYSIAVLLFVGFPLVVFMARAKIRRLMLAMTDTKQPR